MLFQIFVMSVIIFYIVKEYYFKFAWDSLDLISDDQTQPSSFKLCLKMLEGAKSETPLNEAELARFLSRWQFIQLPKEQSNFEEYRRASNKVSTTTRMKIKLEHIEREMHYCECRLLILNNSLIIIPSP
jgi:hypothetical protein